MIRQKLEELLKQAITRAVDAEDLNVDSIPSLELERTKEKAYGDWATNIAMVLAGAAKLPPRKIAENIIQNIDEEGRKHYLEKIEIAGPGFINFFLNKAIFYEVLERIEKLDKNYGRLDLGKGLKVQVEFVSANPVGPLHLGHGRWAVVGDTLANLLKATGFKVTKEFYINDYGRQVNLFGLSVEAKYCELQGIKISFPEEGYQGEYVHEVARSIFKEVGGRYLDLPEEERRRKLRDHACKIMLRQIKETLARIDVEFDYWFSEKSLHQSGAITAVISELKKKGYAYERDGALWLKTSEFGDDKDRVLVRQSGEPTYFAADVAYHKDKLQRGFRKIIDLWGADHHGYVGRVKAALKALNGKTGDENREVLEVIIGQLVNLMRGGRPVKMSKRTGEIVTFGELLDEVGKDAVRYFLLMRSTDTALDFDIELAKEQSNENPVYYVQYAHARICSILKYAGQKGATYTGIDKVDLSLLKEEPEFDLIRRLEEFEEIVEKATAQRAPYLLTIYAQDLATAFHFFYTKCRVISNDKALTAARLALINCTHIVLRNILGLMGVSAPESM